MHASTMLYPSTCRCTTLMTGSNTCHVCMAVQGKTLAAPSLGYWMMSTWSIQGALHASLLSTEESCLPAHLLPGPGNPACMPLCSVLTVWPMYCLKCYAAGLTNKDNKSSTPAAVVSGTIAALKLIQAYHTARFAPFRSLSACFMAFIVLLLEAAYSTVVMLSHLQDNAAGNKVKP